MKSRASLFLTVLLLALSLTACGKEPAKNDRNDAGSGQNSAYDAVSDPNRDNVPNNDAIIGRDDHTVTAPDTNPAPNPANDPAGDLPGASMDRMLRRPGALCTLITLSALAEYDEKSIPRFFGRRIAFGNPACIVGGRSTFQFKCL